MVPSHFLRLVCPRAEEILTLVEGKYMTTLLYVGH